jgi:hypothetical protein
MPELRGQIAVIMKRKRFDYHGNLAAPAICSHGAQRSECKTLERVALSSGILAESGLWSTAEQPRCGSARLSYYKSKYALIINKKLYYQGKLFYQSIHKFL